MRERVRRSFFTQRVPAATALLLAAEGLVELGKAFGVTLLLVTSLPTSDDGTLLGIAHDGGMNLTQIHAHEVVARCRLGLLAVLYH
jgi:hypothetical protein